jgi:hypothetical protein
VADITEPEEKIERAEMKPSVLVVIIIVASTVGAIVFPFGTYAVTLATFGLAHVAIELRYIDSRFHHQIDRTLELRLVILLIAIGWWRCCAIFGWLAAEIAHILELGCGLGLVLLATQYLGGFNWRSIFPGIILSGILGVGIIRDPIATSVILSIVHNLTPIGFVLERQVFKNYLAVLMCGVIFGVMPFLIFIWQLLHPSAPVDLASDSVYLSAFVASAWQKSSIAYPLFSAAVFLQCMHYTAVIGLFSQWTQDRSPTLLPWFDRRYFYIALGAISICLLIAYQHDFRSTRSIYGIVASIHAWLEIPLLLLLTQQLVQQQSTKIRSKISTE